MKMLRAAVIVLAFLATPALAQWQTKNHSVPVGKGAGQSGFSAVGPCNAGIPFVGAGVSADPACGPLALGAGGAVSGNLPVANLNGGTNASALTAWCGNGTWCTPPGSYIGTPQGYLNLVGLTAGNGDVVQTADVSGASTVYYSPFQGGNQIPIWNGTAFQNTVFAELAATLTSVGSIANTIQDMCVFSNSGTPTLVVGPAWSTVTQGSGARGSGAGTAQLARLQGVWVNAVQISAYNGVSSFTVPANQCTYVGSISVDGTAGQVTANRAYGVSRKFGVWNAYNRQNIILQAGDPTSSWTYGTATIRPSNNNGANAIQTFTGLPEEQITVTFTQFVSATLSSANTAVTWKIGIGWNVTNAFSGLVTTQSVAAGSGSNTVTVGASGPAVYVNQPGIGINTATSLEDTTAASGGNPTFSGTASNMLLTAQYRG